MRKPFLTLSMVVIAVHALSAQQSTRGLGVYPGDVREDFAPTFRIDSTSVRNLARHRPAFHSSSYDYNLTAQLVTDGIIATEMPRWIVTATGQDGVLNKDRLDMPLLLAEQPVVDMTRRQGVLSKQEREVLFDGNWVTGVDLRGPRAWVQVELHGGNDAPLVGRVEVDGRIEPSRGPENWTCSLLGSDDGVTWRDLGSQSGMSIPGGQISPAITLATPSRLRFYRILFEDRRAVSWRVHEARFSHAGTPVRIGGPHQFASAWMSAGRGQEWVSVDLGAPCVFDRVAMHWLRRPSEGAIQVSDDGSTWRTAQDLATARAVSGPGAATVQDVRLATPARARHVRVRMTKASSPDGYVLTELEVFGRGGPVPVPHAPAAVGPDGRLPLSGGRWRIERASQVKADGPALASAGYDDAAWLPATVPGTVLTSYLNAGALPDPNVGDHQLMISDSFFHADFWYRTEFDTAPPAPGRRRWLGFDGVNWNAEVYLNGERLGRIDGGFARARFDITRRLRLGAPNALAVRVEKVASPGIAKEKTFDNPSVNGGALGADSPTYQASVGWDWMPTIRGRNTGIWNEVSLSETGPVTIERPQVSTTLPLPDTTSADVHLAATLRNHDTAPVSGVLRGRFGDVTVETPVNVPAGGTREVALGPATHAALHILRPRLWWPNGYGEPDLYDVELRFEAAGSGSVSDTKWFKAGIRQFTHDVDGGTLHLWINGRRFVPLGGNWGFPESMLRYRGREYDAAVRYHRDQHFTMIRNWVGQTGDDEFYDACDRHGIVVWQDFWLANPWDGPDPSSATVFLDNARDLVDRIRTHPSVGLYCGRNEGYPPKPLDDALRALVAERHPGVPYISNSADDVASGHGPYRAWLPLEYFLRRATPKIHSEMGMPSIVSIESLRLMMPESSAWPLGRMFGLHDFSLDGAQGGWSFLDRVQRGYGSARDLAEWVRLAQMVGYDGYRAMFEAQGRNRMGLLIWMSHPAWPSLVWQTYDYYLEPTAAYFGAKKACEPLHIQWNPLTESVEVVNYHAGAIDLLEAAAEVLDMDGRVRWHRTVALRSEDDSVAAVLDLEYPLGISPVHFIRLTLRRAGVVVSENFYWRGLDDGDFRALRDLPDATVESSVTAELEGGDWRVRIEMRNTSATPALMVKASVVRERSGDRILPVLFDDNYVALMPGETKTITARVRVADTRGEPPRVEIEGFNLRAAPDVLRRDLGGRGERAPHARAW